MNPELQQKNHMQTQRPPLFSIIIPTYNRPHSLYQCLQSVCGMNDYNHLVQTIVVNDGSTLSYEDVIKSFHDTMELLYVYQRQQGPAAARNNGASHAHGHFLVFLDDDCTLSQEWLQTAQKQVFINSIVGGRTINCLTNNVFAQTSQVLIDYLYEYYNRDTEHAFFITSNNIIVSRDIFNTIDGFDMDYKDAAAEDRDFCNRLISSGYTIKLRRDIVIHHSHHLGFKNFIKQHYRYGYNAHLFHKKRADHDSSTIQIEPLSFYLKLLIYPFRYKLLNALHISFLLLLSQSVNAIGFLKAKLNADAG